MLTCNGDVVIRMGSCFWYLHLQVKIIIFGKHNLETSKNKKYKIQDLEWSQEELSSVKFMGHSEILRCFQKVLRIRWVLRLEQGTYWEFWKYLTVTQAVSLHQHLELSKMQAPIMSKILSNNICNGHKF